jgi:hypothetical protein
MHNKTTLDFSYVPADMFEGETSVPVEQGAVVFSTGAAILTLTAPANPVGTHLIQAATASIRAVLQARQVLTRRSFELRGPNITHHRENGGRDVVIIAGTGQLKITGFSADVRITSADGTVVRDTRIERLVHDRAFMQRLAAKAATSPTLRRMLESFSQSVSDPGNELVHLYEIRDAAVEHFDGDSQARKRLGISKADWSTLGRLANDEPLKQGRHRGKQIDGLRDATSEELGQARTIGRRILEALAEAP